MKMPNMHNNKMSIAIVHDSLREYGGAERVLEVIHETFPDAPVYTSYVDLDGLGKHAWRFSGWDIRQSWLSKIPIVAKYMSPLRFLAPGIWKSFDLSNFDVVITSSGWFIPRGVTIAPHTKHVCYLHHPPRNLYGYPTGSTLQKYPIVRAYAAFINFFLRQYDFTSAQTVDIMLTNSKETSRRAWKFYRKRSSVVYPPIHIPKKPGLSPKEQLGVLRRLGVAPKTYFLSVSRLSWAKRVDCAILACNKLAAPLVVVGSGKEEGSLRALSGPTIHFAGSVSDPDLDALYRNAKALIFCALDEDFGMVPVESMARGTPVIALDEGGTKETVLKDKTGILFSSPTAESLMEAIRQFESIQFNWRGASINHSKNFSSQIFSKKLQNAVYLKKASYVRKS